MLVLHPSFLEKEEIKEFAVLPFDEFKKVEDELKNFEDLKNLRKAKRKEGHITGLSLTDAKIKLKI